MRDTDLSELLSSRGFEGDGTELALAELCRRGLTRRGKKRIGSSARKATIPSAHSMMMTDPVARPLKPSMMFTAFARPAMTKTVNAMEIRGSDMKSSMRGISTRVTESPVRMQKIKAESIVASKRKAGGTFFDRSSARPATKPIRLLTPRTSRSERTGESATAAAARSPAYKATPPILGVGSS